MSPGYDPHSINVHHLVLRRLISDTQMPSDERLISELQLIQYLFMGDID